MPIGILYTLGAYVLWGAFPLYFHALADISAAEILAHRIVWSLAFVALLLLAMRRWAWVKDAFSSPKVLLIFTCSSFLIAVNWGTYVYAIVSGRTLEASLGYFINPLMSIALGSVFLKERLRPVQYAAVALAAVGVAWITWQTGNAPWLGLALAGSFALYGLVRKVAPLPSLEGLALETVILTPIALGYLACLAAEGNLAFASASSGTQWLLAAAGPITCIPLLLFAGGVRRIPYSVVGIIQYTSPTIVFLIATFWFKEPFSLTLFIGFVIIWCSVALFAGDSVRHLAQQKKTANDRAAKA